MNTYIHLKQPTEAETSASLHLLALIVSFFFWSVGQGLAGLYSFWIVAKTLLFAQLGPDTLGIEQGNKLVVETANMYRSEGW